MRHYFSIVVLVLLTTHSTAYAEWTKLDSANFYMTKADTLLLLDEHRGLAKKYYEKAEVLFNQMNGFEEQEIYCTHRIGGLFLDYDYHKAINKALYSIQLLKTYGLDTPEYLVDFYYALHLAYESLKKRDKAIQYLELGMDCAKRFEKERNYEWASALAQAYFRDARLYNPNKRLAIEITAVLFYWKTGNHEKSTAYLKRYEALRATTRNKNACDELDANLQLAKQNDDFDEMIDVGGALLQKVEDSVWYGKRLRIAKIASLVSYAYLSLGMKAQAVEYAAKSLTHLEHVHLKGLKRTNSLGKSYNRIGELYREIGEYHKAMEYYRQAYEISRINQGRISFSVGSVSNNIGETYYALGQYEEALEWHKQALDIRLKIENHPYRTNSYDNLGMTYLKLGDMKKAKLYLDKALAARSKYPKISWYERYYIKSYAHLAEWYKENGQLYNAIRFVKKAIAANLSNNQEDRLSKFLYWNKLGELYKATNQYEQALAAYQEAIKLNTNDLGETINHSYDPQALLLSLAGKADIFKTKAEKLPSKKKEYLTEALSVYVEAMEVLEKIRKSFTTQADKLNMIKVSRPIYNEAMSVAYQLYLYNEKAGYKELMFEIAEKSKAGVLLDIQNQHVAQHQGILPDSLVVQESRITNNLSYIQQKLQKSNGEARMKLEHALFNAKRKQETFNERLEEEFPEYYRLKYRSLDISVKQVQEQLNSDDSFLEFFEADSMLFAFFLDKNRFMVKAMPKLSRKTIQEFRASLLDNDLKKYIRSSHQIYQDILAPLGKIENKMLTIVPDGMIWHINFDLLLQSMPETGDYRTFNYLINDHATRYAYSALYLKSASTEELEGTLLAFGPSYESLNQNEDVLEGLGKFRGEVGELKHNQEEVQNIGNLLHGDVFVGTKAVERNFKKELAEHAVLHLAMHALIDNDEPMNSRLVFTHMEDSIEDNFLHVYEIYNMQLEADLVVLSACNTGFGKLESGEGFMSLGRAFAYAGCPSVIMSQWKVDDLATSKIMKSFYEHLESGVGKAEAMRASKLAYLKTCNAKEASPFLWGSFIVMGDDAAIAVEKSFEWWIVGTILGLLLIGGIVWYKR